MTAFEGTCSACGQNFTVTAQVMQRYPGWRPSTCMDCRKRGGTKAGPRGVARGTAATTPKPSSGVDGADDPQSGIFTDGSCRGNPGPGGWGLVHVEDGVVLAERCGTDAVTTNNRMELTALIEAYRLAADLGPVRVYTDSELCFNTVTRWAAAWERAGWKRREGPIKNLDLVQRLYALSKERPNVTLRWLRGHATSRWNERADGLARGCEG